MSYTHLYIAQQGGDSGAVGWLVAGVRRRAGGSVLLGSVTSLREAEELAERYGSRLVVSEQVRSDMQKRPRAACGH